MARHIMCTIFAATGTWLMLAECDLLKQALLKHRIRNMAPSSFTLKSDPVKEIMKGEPGLIRDKAQVRAMAEFAEYRDRQGKTGRPHRYSKGLDEDKVRVCVQQEGWILGAV